MSASLADTVVTFHDGQALTTGRVFRVWGQRSTNLSLRRESDGATFVRLLADVTPLETTP